MHPKVSICIPTYNGESYLHQCLKSAMEQSFSDIEIVVCDDCSSDKTIEIVKEFQKVDGRIVLFQNEKNLGLVGNWNRCIDNAKGEWIKYLFQDDYLEKDCVAKMVALIKEQTQLVICEREYIFDENVTKLTQNQYHRVTRLYKSECIKAPLFLSKEKMCRLSLKYLSSNFIGEPTSTLFKKEIVKSLGYFTTELIQICDLEFCLRIAVNHGMTYAPEKLVAFRVHYSSTSTKNNSKNIFTSVFIDRIILLHKFLYQKEFENVLRFNNLYRIKRCKLALLTTFLRANDYVMGNLKTPELKTEYETVLQKTNFQVELDKLKWLFYALSRIRYYKIRLLKRTGIYYLIHK